MSPKNNQSNWFEVDKEGLAKLLKRRGMEFVVFELLQNCYDTKALSVSVDLKSTGKRGVAELSVIDDDPDGFSNLSHAYTLFAESSRKGDPTKRGRFNLGEKLILASCENAEVRSTKGTVVFNTGRHVSKKKRQVGTEFFGHVRMTKSEVEDVINACQYIIPPIDTIVNGIPIKPRKPIHEFIAALATEISDSEGILRRTVRQTKVRVYEHVDDKSRLYELGIPVVETDDPWDIEIMQKVPLNVDRDNVTPGYLREVRTKVLNEMHLRLSVEDASLPSVIDTLANASYEAVNTVLTHQYGEKRAIFDPSDQEANRVLQTQGYQLISRNAFRKDSWKNIREAGAAKPAGQIAPTYQPYQKGGKPAIYIPKEDWTPELVKIAEYINKLGRRLIGKSVTTLFEKGRMTSPFRANYGQETITFNYDRLGKKWFKKNLQDTELNELIIHELAHEYGEHLTKEFDNALASIGAKLLTVALNEPEIFVN